VCGQLVNSIPELDAKLYASHPGRRGGGHVEVFERYVKKLHKIYPVDPLLKSLLDEILATTSGAEALGMQMIVEGLAIAAFTSCASRPATRRSRQLLDYVLQDEGRHVNFGLLRAAAVDPEHDAAKREYSRISPSGRCDHMYARDERTGFQSVKSVGPDGLGMATRSGGTPSETPRRRIPSTAFCSRRI